MPRTAGSVGLVKQEFEEQFRKECRKRKLSLAAGCAEFLQDAQDKCDWRQWVAVAAIATKLLPDPQSDMIQQPLFVIDRRTGETDTLTAVSDSGATGNPSAANRHH